MPEKINLTAKKIGSLQPPEKGFSLFYDEKVPGLAVMVTAAGAKTYYRCGRANGKPQRIKIAKCHEVTLADARQQCQKLNSDIALGKHRSKSSEQIKTLGDLFHWYLTFHAKPHKKSWKRDERRYELHLTGWEDKRIEHITTSMVKEFHSGLGERIGPCGANHVLELLRMMFSVAIQEGKCDLNPTRTTKRFQEHSRERYLLPEEVPAFFEALKTFPVRFQHYVSLLIFTGARRGNVEAMRWEQVHLSEQVWNIPATAYKAKTAVTIPLIEPAMEILQWRHARKKNEWVFPTSSKSGHYQYPYTSWQRLCRDADIEDLRIHDLRRTLGSWQAIQGTSLHVIGKSLGHTSTASTSIYARLSNDPVRQSVGKAVDAILDAAGKNKK